MRHPLCHVLLYVGRQCLEEVTSQSVIRSVICACLDKCVLDRSYYRSISFLNTIQYRIPPKNEMRSRVLGWSTGQGAVIWVGFGSERTTVVIAELFKKVYIFRMSPISEWVIVIKYATKISERASRMSWRSHLPVGPEKRRKAGLLGRLYPKSAGHQVSYRENLVHWQLPMPPAVQNSRPTQEAESSEYTYIPERYTHGS